MTSPPNQPDKQPDKQEPVDFSELAALSALDILTPEESNLVEINYADHSEFSVQRAEFEAVVGAIAYSSPPMPMNNNLKDRLWQRISENIPQLQPKLLDLLKISIAELKQKTRGLSWEPIPSMSNAAMATLEVDEATRQVAFFVRAQAGERFPNHWHAQGEEILVLEGDVVIDEQIYHRGSRISSQANTTHQPTTINGCLVICISSLDDQFL